MKVVLLLLQLLLWVQVSLPLLSPEQIPAKTDIHFVSTESIIAVQCRYRTTAIHDPQPFAHRYPQTHPTATTRAF